MVIEQKLSRQLWKKAKEKNVSIEGTFDVFINSKVNYQKKNNFNYEQINPFDVRIMKMYLHAYNRASRYIEKQPIRKI